MTSARRTSLALVLGAALLVPVTIFAAFSPREQQFEAGLRPLYASALQQDVPEKSLQDRIAAERAKVRKALTDELNALVDEATKDDTDKEATVLSAFEKQKAIVGTLETRGKETSVDLDVLREEESALELEISQSTTNAMKQRLLQRQAGLYARRAVLEERAAAIGDVLEIQNDRLQRLTAQERTETFAVVATVGVYAGIFVLILLIERILRQVVLARIADRNRRYVAMKLFTGTVYIVLTAWVLYRLAADYPGILTSFAIIGAGVALALQTVIKDAVAWLIIVQKRLYTLGQRVTIGPYTGDVADITLLRTTLSEVSNSETPDPRRSGQFLHLPNSLILEKPVLNFSATSDFVENEIRVTVAHESDWRKAEAILQGILEELTGEYVERARRQHLYRTTSVFIAHEPPGPRVFLEIAPEGVLFILRYYVPIGQVRTITSHIHRTILERFADADPSIVLR